VTEAVCRLVDGLQKSLSDANKVLAAMIELTKTTAVAQR
jgi:hypothetical protein